MITLTAKIELSGAYSNLLSAASPSLVDNAEDTEVNSFIIGESRLGEGAVFGGSSSGAITEIVINQRNLISLESSIFDRSDIKLPSWGIISNGGRLEFNDPYGDVKRLAEAGVLGEGLRVTIFLKDTLSNYSTVFNCWQTSDLSYDDDNKVATFTLTDGLTKLQSFSIGDIPLEYSTRNAFFIITKFIEYVRSAGFDIDLLSIDAKTSDVLNKTEINYAFLNGGTLWSQLQKICELCGLYIYTDSIIRNKLMISHEFRG